MPSGENSGILDINKYAEMSEQERDDVYVRACKAAGIAIDPQALMNLHAAEKDDKK